MGTKAIWTIAHRGASGHAPENTMAAFRRAVELGARFIETDLQITRDARVIAIHDFTLDRTTSGKGQVHLLTLEQIRALDAGAWFGDRGAGSFAGERVPTLEEILDFAKEHDVIFYLEIKSGPAWGVEHAVVAALRDQNASARVVILSFDPSTLDSVHRLDQHDDDRILVRASVERFGRAHGSRGSAAACRARRPHHARRGREGPSCGFAGGGLDDQRTGANAASDRGGRGWNHHGLSGPASRASCANHQDELQPVSQCSLCPLC